MRSSTRPTVPDHDVAARLELGLLRADRGAAEDGHDVDALAGPVGADGLGDLDAQLARGVSTSAWTSGTPGIDVLDHRQAERGGLARARLGLADHVPPASMWGMACSWMGLGFS
jgi:hypothetical protein